MQCANWHRAQSKGSSSRQWDRCGPGSTIIREGPGASWMSAGKAQGKGEGTDNSKVAGKMRPEENVERRAIWG